MHKIFASFPRRIVILYVLFAGAWICFSDQLLLYLITDPQLEGRLQTLKGWGFVAISALLLHMLLRQELSRRQETETALRRSEQRYRRIVETTDEGIWMIDANEQTIFVNAKMAHLLGYTVDEMIGVPLFAFMDTEGQAIAKTALERRRQGIREYIETKYLHRDGHDFWAIAATSPVEDDQGHYAGALAMVTDITDRKHAEHALRASEERFRRLSEATFEGIGICQDNIIVDSNAQLAEMLGYTQAELVGIPTENLVAPASRELVHNYVQGNYEGRYEHLALRKDGSIFPVEVRSRWLPEQGPHVRVTIVQDISERFAAQQALLRSEQRFRAIFEHSAMGMALVDMNGHMLLVNPALETFLGYSASELHELCFADVLYPDDLVADSALFEELLSGKRECYQLEKRYLRKDKQVVWGRLTASLIMSDVDEPLLSIRMIEDITEWKRIEQQHRDAQKMEALGRLAGGVAHDFNNLLTVILGSCEILLDELGPEHPLSRDVVPIQRAGAHASTLSRQLLTFSRHHVRELEILDLNSVVIRMEALLRRTLGEDITLITQLAPEVASIQADVSQMEQVLLNLAINARDAMPHGGMLFIKTTNTAGDGADFLERNGMTSASQVLLTISDTGHGMDTAIQARMFEPFFTTKAPGKGTGLGLSTVYGIVQQSGGHIEVVSEVGQGTTFYIYLPQTSDKAIARQMLSEITVAQQDSGTILLTEDEPLVRSLASRILRARGYQVLEAEDGATALRIAAAYPGTIDVLLTDVIMPGGINGPQLAEELCRQRPTLRVLYMSGYTDTAIAYHTALDLHQHVLQKPFTAAALTQRIWHLVHAKEQQISKAS